LFDILDFSFGLLAFSELNDLLWLATMTRHWKAGCPADEQLKVIIRQIPDLLAPNLPLDRLKYIFNHVPIFQEYSFDVFRKRFRLAVDEICLRKSSL
jgi:hypothetical protein